MKYLLRDNFGIREQTDDANQFRVWKEWERNGYSVCVHGQAYSRLKAEKNEMGRS